MVGAGELRTYLVWAFGWVLAAWATLSAMVLLNRAWYDLRARRLDVVARRLESGHRGRASSDLDALEMKRVLRTLSRRAIYRMIARPSTSDAVAHACAVYALERWGMDRMLSDASSHTRITKWRRIAALLALAHLRAAPAYELLAAALEDPDQDVAGGAVLCLSRLGDSAAASILAQALRRKSYAPSRIATQLERFEIPLVEVLRPLLSDAEKHARYWGASIVAASPDLHTVLPDLIRLTGDPDPSVRKAAIETLSGSVDHIVALVVLARMVDSAPYVRSAAIRTLARAPDGIRRQNDVIEALSAALADESWEVRNAAKEALVTIGPAAWQSVARQLDSADAFARNGAAEVLQNLGLLDQLIEMAASGQRPDPEAIRVLQRAFDEGGPMMVDAAMVRTAAHADADVVSMLAGIGLRPAT